MAHGAHSLISLMPGRWSKRVKDGQSAIFAWKTKSVWLRNSCPSAGRRRGPLEILTGLPRALIEGEPNTAGAWTRI